MPGLWPLTIAMVDLPIDQYTSAPHQLLPGQGAGLLQYLASVSINLADLTLSNTIQYYPILSNSFKNLVPVPHIPLGL